MINCSSELKMLEVVVAISKSFDTSNVQQTTTKPELTSLLTIPNSKRSEDEDDKMIDQYLRRSQDYQDLQEDHEIMGNCYTKYMQI